MFRSLRKWISQGIRVAVRHSTNLESIAMNLESVPTKADELEKATTTSRVEHELITGQNQATNYNKAAAAQAARSKVEEVEEDPAAKKKPTALKCNQIARERERTTLTLKTGSIYHVMNSTCIHLRAKDSNLYMYRRGRIYKEPLEKYNNRKG
jgi:nitrogen fixation/metabolism regulation signal transduction histidine kinase